MGDGLGGFFVPRPTVLTIARDHQCLFSSSPCLCIIVINSHRTCVFSANIKITAKLFGGILPVWSKTVDVCAEAKICPIDLGERDLDFSTELPGNIPSVTLYLKIEGKNANGEPLSCFQGKFVPQ